MKLIKYNQFLKESIVDILLERSDFWNCVFDLNDENPADLPVNYSDMCKVSEDSHGKDSSWSVEGDYLKMQNFMDSRGFTFDKIKSIFSKENDKKCRYDIFNLITGDLSYRDFFSNYEKITTKESYEKIREPFKFSSLDSKSGYVDIYLYKTVERLGLDNKKIHLGGDGWSDMSSYDGEYSEEFIRYKYGYHTTKYGKLWMEQLGISKEYLASEALKHLQEYIEEEFESIVKNSIFNKVHKSFSLNLPMNLDDYSIVEEDRMIINIKKIIDYVSSVVVLMTLPPFLIGFKLTEEELVSQFFKDLDDFKLDMEFTDYGELIIYSIFKEK
jgi:hypothetical protein